MSRSLALVLACCSAVVVSAGQAPVQTRVEAAFAAFFQARTSQDAAPAAAQVRASGVGFDEALARLRSGRTYSRDVPKGVVPGSYRSDGGEFFYTLHVPDTYDPGRKYQVRVQLHGGVDRVEDSRPRDAGAAVPLAGADQIYVMP